MAEITITLPSKFADGLKVEVNGVKGKGCHALTAPLEKLLGTVKDRKNKPEFSQKAESKVSARK